MKKKIGTVTIIILLLAVMVTVASSLYIVHQKEYVAVRQFGKVVDIKESAGLYIKIPYIQSTQTISARTLLYDIAASDVITRDKKSMITDTYVLWKVEEPLKYIQSLNALSGRAEERIEAAVYNATKNVISSMSQDEIIEARGERLTTMITQEANSDMQGYGIVILQAQIKALDLPDDNKQAVYERMISERQNIAASYTAEGNAEAQKIRNETDKQVNILKADAERQAAILEAEGEAEYMKTLREAYDTEEKADFYNYIRSLDALKVSMKGSKTIILDRDSELARILYGSEIRP